MGRHLQQSAHLDYQVKNYVLVKLARAGFRELLLPTACPLANPSIFAISLARVDDGKRISNAQVTEVRFDCINHLQPL